MENVENIGIDVEKIEKEKKEKAKKARNPRIRRFAGTRNYRFENYNKIINEETNEEKWEQKENFLTEEEWKEQIIKEFTDFNALGGCDEIYFVFHDRDFTDDEYRVKKELHVHFVVYYKNPRDYYTILKYFKCEPRNFGKVANKTAVLRYLTHTTEDAMKAKKTRYNVSELYIYSNMPLNNEEDVYSLPKELTGDIKEQHYRINIAGNKKGNATATENIKDVVDELCVLILEGTLNAENIIKNLDEMLGDKGIALRTWTDNRKRFEQIQEEYYRQKFIDWVDNGRKFNTIYINGPGGTGKTNIARKLIKKYLTKAMEIDSTIHSTSYHSVSNAGNRKLDFLSGYNFQNVTLFDDLSPKGFDYYEFLNVFDKTQMNLYSSRFNNKSWFSELAVITRSTDIDDYIDSICKISGVIDVDILESGEEDEHTTNIKYQVARRLPLIIDITEERTKGVDNTDEKEYLNIILKVLKGNSSNYEYFEIDRIVTDKTRKVFNNPITAKEFVEEIGEKIYEQFKLQDLLIDNKKSEDVFDKVAKDVNNNERYEKNLIEFKQLKLRYLQLVEEFSAFEYYGKKTKNSKKLQKQYKDLLLDEDINIMFLIRKINYCELMFKKVKQELIEHNLNDIRGMLDKFATTLIPVLKESGFVKYAVKKSKNSQSGVLKSVEYYENL